MTDYLASWFDLLRLLETHIEPEEGATPSKASSSLALATASLVQDRTPEEAAGIEREIRKIRVKFPRHKPLPAEPDEDE